MIWLRLAFHFWGLLLQQPLPFLLPLLKQQVKYASDVEFFAWSNPVCTSFNSAAAAADDLNLFGEDDDDDGDETAEEKAATKARQERMALARKYVC